MLVLARRHVEQVLDIDSTIAAVETAFAEFARGRTLSPLRTVLHLDEADGDIFIMPAYIPALASMATKIVSVVPTNPKTAGLPTTIGAVLLNDAKTGAPLCLMDGSWLTAVRTGAVSAVAAKYLARPDSRTVALMGCGAQGRTQALAVSRVLPIEEILVFDLDSDRAAGLAAELTSRTGIMAQAVSKAEDAARKADVVLCATTSRQPVVLGEWTRPGTFVSSVGSYLPEMREVDAALVRSAKVVVDSRETALSEAGDLIIPLERGEISPDHIFAELGEVIIGSRPGRQSGDELVFFKSVGMAIQDAAAARKAYEGAVKAGIGTRVDL